MLSETPTNDAVNFVTGAGGFLQQVIFGYTGLRLGERGLEPAFPPVLPSRHQPAGPPKPARPREALRRGGGLVRPTHPAARGGRPPVIALALLLAAADGRSAPVLAFPEPGVDDTAAYQGYQTRFYRDSKDNTVQIYLEPRGGRVVNLWADAADESLGFTVRDARGRPPRLTWAADSAEVGDSGGHAHARIPARGRVAERDARAGSCWARCGSSATSSTPSAICGRTPRRPTYVAEESLLVANVARLPADERQRQLELLGAASVAALRSRLQPRLADRCSAAACTCGSGGRRSTGGTASCSSCAPIRGRPSCERGRGRSRFESRSGRAGSAHGPHHDRRRAAHAARARLDLQPPLHAFLAEARATDSASATRAAGWSARCGASSS